jgi:crotonobetainyl-CoA:carnitine CoA-transferase CaiB-like acyl-CoA transferase
LKKFCAAVGRPELFDRWPGSEYGDHARGNRELQRELTSVFATKSTQEWIDFGIEVDVPIAPVNTPRTVQDDPQFRDRFEWLPAAELGADQLPLPIKIGGPDDAPITKAPELGEHTDAVLRDVLGYDADRIAALRADGAIG